MPRFDGKGPRGMGPRMGRGVGHCGFAMGCGMGPCGFGMGCRNCPFCPFGNPMSKKDQKAYLEEYLESLEGEIKNVKKALEDLPKTA